MGCKCKNNINQHVDLTGMEPQPWDDAKILTGLTECGDFIAVEKPEGYIGELDREKLDSITLDGDGSSALFNDGMYKEVYTSTQSDQAIADALEEYYTKTETDGKISSALEDYYTKSEVNTVIDDALTDVVKYDDNNDVHLRNNLILGNDHKVLGTALDGRQFNLIEISRFSDEGHPIADVASTSIHLNFNSIDRPAVQLQGESGAQAHEIAYFSEVQEVQSNLDNTSQDLKDLSDETDAFRTTVNNAFNTVNGELSDLSDRITENTENISLNRSDIDGLISTVNNIGHFRGYKATTTDVTSIENPREDDYAYNVQTGTIWSYNGTTWFDTEEPIPDGAIPASDSIPLVDSGTGSPGTSDEYSRGDHRHPSDMTKADVSELENFIPKSGNSQTERISGDLWASTGVNYRFTDSGNSYLGQETDTQTSVLTGAGAGGIDLRTSLGTVKVNGSDIATLTDIPGTLPPNGEAGGDLTGTYPNPSIAPDSVNESKLSAGIPVSKFVNDVSYVNATQFGTKQNVLTAGSNITIVNDVISGPTLTSQLANNSGYITNAALSGYATLNYVDGINNVLSGNITSLGQDVNQYRNRQIEFEGEVNTQFTLVNSAINTNASNITTNTSDIESLRSQINNNDKFRGWYDSNAEIQSLTGTVGDSAYSLESNTIWVYTSLGWVDSGRAVPSADFIPSDTLPLIDGEASAGTSVEYSRGDHRHPTDTTRQPILESGVNIKTINGSNILGSGNIDIDVITPKTYEGNPTSAGSVVVPGTLTKILMVFYKRVLLSSSEYTVTGNTINITNANINVTTSDVVQILFY